MGEARSILIFGAGSIGRGLLGELAQAAGRRPVFVEADPALAAALARAGRYVARLVGREETVREIAGFDVVRPEERERVGRAVAECEFAATAVGGAHLDEAARIAAPHIVRRREPLNIIVCENFPHAEERLRNALLRQGAPERLFACVGASVERMARPGAAPLEIIAENGQTLFVNRAQWAGRPPRMEGLEFCDGIEALYARKLFTNNAGHALLAYRGAQIGARFIHEALARADIREHLEELLNGAARALTLRYGLDAEAASAHVDTLMRVRFAHRALADPVRRVARDPIRKLRPQERLVGLIRLLESVGLPTEPASRVVAAALTYADPDDAESIQLQEMIRRDGPESVLLNVCGLRSGERCFQEILAELAAFQTSFVHR